MKQTKKPRRPLRRDIIDRQQGTGHHLPIDPAMEATEDWVVYRGGEPVSSPMTYANALAAGRSLPVDGRTVEIIRTSHDPSQPYPRRQAGMRTRWLIRRGANADACKRLVAWARKEFGPKSWQSLLSAWLAAKRYERTGLESPGGMYDYRAIRRWASTAKGNGTRRLSPPAWVMRLVGKPTGHKDRQRAEALAEVDRMIAEGLDTEF